jgi:hypothetical protein
VGHKLLDHLLFGCLLVVVPTFVAVCCCEHDHPDLGAANQRGLDTEGRCRAAIVQIPDPATSVHESYVRVY